MRRLREWLAARRRKREAVDIGYALRHGGWFQAPSSDAEIDIQNDMGGLPPAPPA